MYYAQTEEVDNMDELSQQEEDKPVDEPTLDTSSDEDTVSDDEDDDDDDGA